MVAKADALKGKYATPQTYATLREDAAHWEGVAKEFASQAGKISNIDDNKIDEAESNYKKLSDLRGFADIEVAAGRGQNFISSIINRITVERLTAPIYWLISVGTPVVERQIAFQEAATAVTKAPKAGLDWLLDLLGLPRWAPKVLIGAGVLGLGAWAYITFLAPVGKVVKAARQTSRRAG